MHVNDGRVDHLHRSVMGISESVHEPGPDTGTPPANEAIVARRVWTEVARQVAPWRARA
jgi:hypothetical protein